MLTARGTRGVNRATPAWPNHGVPSFPSEIIRGRRGPVAGGQRDMFQLVDREPASGTFGTAAETTPFLGGRTRFTCGPSGPRVASECVVCSHWALVHYLAIETVLSA